MNQLLNRIFAFTLTLLAGLLVVRLLPASVYEIPQPKSEIGQAVSVPTAEEYSGDASAQINQSLNNLEGSRVEQFSDEKRIGRRGKSRIEIRCFSRGDERYAEIKFFTRSEYGAWLEVQSFKFEKDGITGCDPEIKDFNNDGLNDFTFQSNVAARGANEVRKLFIYDKKRDELVYIKNSEDYPNMVYNKRRDCIDAWLFHGATTTVFLKIDGDRLREIAMVNTGLERVVEVFDEAGDSHVISRKKMKEQDIYTRYLDFNPVVTYRE